jgi:hypothetical protein
VLLHLVKEGVLFVSAVGRILQDELRACAEGGGEENRGAPGDLICPSQLSMVPCRHVLDAQDLVSLAYNRWALVSSWTVGGKMPRDRVRAAWWSGEDGRIVAVAHEVEYRCEESII